MDTQVVALGDAMNKALDDAQAIARANTVASRSRANDSTLKEFQGWTAEETETYDRAFEDYNTARESYERARKAHEAKRATGETEERKSAGEIAQETASTSGEERKFDENELTVRFMHDGADALSKEERQFLGIGSEGGNIFCDHDVKLKRRIAERIREKRAMGAGDAGAGREHVEDLFWPQLTEALLDFGGMLEVSTVIETATGAELKFPTQDDTTNKGAILAEHAADSEQDVATAETVLGAYKGTSNVVRVSDELEQDHFMAVSPWMGTTLGTRLGRQLNEKCTVGTGSGEPTGITVAAGNSGVQPSVAAGISRNNILDIIHAVDPAYRRQGARHMFNDAILRQIVGIVDGDSRPLYAVDARSGAPSLIEGYPFTVNQDMPAFSATNRMYLFGALRYFTIRRVQAIRLKRLVELYALNHQIGYVSTQRFDSNSIDGAAASNKPIQYAEAVA